MENYIAFVAKHFDDTYAPPQCGKPAGEPCHESCRRSAYGLPCTIFGYQLFPQLLSGVYDLSVAKQAHAYMIMYEFSIVRSKLDIPVVVRIMCSRFIAILMFLLPADRAADMFSFFVQRHETWCSSLLQTMSVLISGYADNKNELAYFLNVFDSLFRYKVVKNIKVKDPFSDRSACLQIWQSVLFSLHNTVVNILMDKYWKNLVVLHVVILQVVRSNYQAPMGFGSLFHYDNYEIYRTKYGDAKSIRYLHRGGNFKVLQLYHPSRVDSTSRFDIIAS